MTHGRNPYLKYKLHTFNHQSEWLNNDSSLNMSLFYKDGLHLIKTGNELLSKAILNYYQSLKSAVADNIVRSFKDVVSFSLNDSDFPPLRSTSNNQIVKNRSELKSHFLPTNKPIIPTCLATNMYLSISRAYMLPISKDDILMSSSKSCNQSIQSSITVLSSSPSNTSSYCFSSLSSPSFSSIAKNALYFTDIFW